ncbi:hypothetical protein Clacol_003469 [Clathrus columnatus]|uniref:Beta-glucuronidase C-terminal domain-containing protein n=1 Tax=Clathrus columnatus TaxID=1419009 RepID=A0AAV5A6F8_9AGAM|nr:hypothetical protein Clacol_003469 [Clathrus columnatus]
MRAILSFLLFPIFVVHASVTIYTQVTFAPGAPSTSSAPLVTQAAHYDLAFAQPPAPPATTGIPPFVVQLQSAPLPGLSKQHTGCHMGFSIELSVADQVVGKNGIHLDALVLKKKESRSAINPQFLNLMQNIKARAGEVKVRVGGNTQEKAVFFPEGLPGGLTITKQQTGAGGLTDTPTINVGIDLIYALANVSALTNTYYFLGLPFNDTSNPRLEIGEACDSILGDHLLGLQLGNEPDLYALHGLRPSDYNVSNYISDIQIMLNAVNGDSKMSNKTNMMGPSVCCLWTSQQASGQIFTIDEAFDQYVGHQTVTDAVSGYISDVQLAEQNGKPYVMLETNTASCAGFWGTSDAFIAALWGLDYDLNMASINASAAMFHLGGQSALYNPFTPPPGAAAKKGYQWTIGPMYYAALIVAEAFGSSSTAQVADLFINNNNTNMAGYVIYQNGKLATVVLINYATDPTGASDFTAQLAIDGSGLNLPNASPPNIFVRRLTTPGNSTADHVPFYYANQTFGPPLTSNGILQGDQVTETISCDATTNLCPVTVKAPSAALVFLNPQAEADSINTADTTPFPTTVTTLSFKNTATINPAVLATSNGYGGLNNQIGSTSFGSSGAVDLRGSLSGVLTVICLLAGASAVLRML